MGVSNKVAAILELCNKYGVDRRNVAYIGDDLNDVEAIISVGLGVGVNDAAEEVKEAADYVTSSQGGNGAVREAADLIIERAAYAG